MSRDIETAILDENPNQPRRVGIGVGIEDLAASVQRHGVLQPLLVRPKGERFEVVAGARRLRAARQAGLASVPCEVRDLSDDEAFEVALAENVQRENLNPVDEALAYQRLMRAGLTQCEIAERIGKHQSYVARKLRYRARLCEGAQGSLRYGEISEGHAVQLMRIAGIADRYVTRARAAFVSTYQLGLVQQVELYGRPVAWLAERINLFELDVAWAAALATPAMYLAKTPERAADELHTGVLLSLAWPFGLVAPDDDRQHARLVDSLTNSARGAYGWPHVLDTFEGGEEGVRRKLLDEYVRPEWPRRQELFSAAYGRIAAAIRVGGRNAAQQDQA